MRPRGVSADAWRDAVGCPGPGGQPRGGGTSPRSVPFADAASCFGGSWWHIAIFFFLPLKVKDLDPLGPNQSSALPAPSLPARTETGRQTAALPIKNENTRCPVAAVIPPAPGLSRLLIPPTARRALRSQRAGGAADGAGISRPQTRDAGLGGGDAPGACRGSFAGGLKGGEQAGAAAWLVSDPPFAPRRTACSSTSTS